MQQRPQSSVSSVLWGADRIHPPRILQLPPLVYVAVASDRCAAQGLLSSPASTIFLGVVQMVNMDLGVTSGLTTEGLNNLIS